MSACCHDIGMVVTEEQRQQLIDDSNSPDWRKHFQRNPGEHSRFLSNKTIDEVHIRSYIRQNHHRRVSKVLTPDQWPEQLARNGLLAQTLYGLCESHGCAIESDQPNEVTTEYDLRKCAVLLRLADIPRLRWQPRAVHPL